MKRVSLLISGRVQRVYFRAATQAKARELGLTGWVKNLPDGSVQAEAQGPASAVSELVAWCHQGPPDALVKQVEWSELDPVPDENEFEVLR